MPACNTGILGSICIVTHGMVGLTNTWHIAYLYYSFPVLASEIPSAPYTRGSTNMLQVTLQNKYVSFFALILYFCHQPGQNLILLLTGSKQVTGRNVLQRKKLVLQRKKLDPVPDSQLTSKYW